METKPNIINFSSSSSSPINKPSKPLPNHRIVDEFWKKFPVGYRFCPQDGELILHYLKKKVLNQQLPPNKIVQVNIYQHNPKDLAEFYKAYKENGAYYFFTPRDRKYRNGDRPSRAAGCGYWKATGANKPVYHKNKRVGSRNALVFYKGKPPHGNKTDWIMHEFKVDNPPPTKRNGINDMRLDNWVLCKIYYKPSRSCKGRNAEEEEEGDPQGTPCDENIPRLTTDTQSGGDVMVSSNEEVEASNGMNKKESESVFEDDHSWSYINPDNSGFGWHQVDWINNANNYNNPYMNFDDFRPPLFK
ncbi:hypothetical protein Dsin_008596 [Dipteronia sinensis]|uniref:NAC domain-containing protein n=1 Tax=Dipteronia sinensis TaxID=43782 RepID=A0AAE0EAY1_9ROSI|nr:hypothetical protein Dsin_008596 [Dipteronia sinensis]